MCVCVYVGSFLFYRSTCQCVVHGSKYPRSACHSRYSSCVNVGVVYIVSRVPFLYLFQTVLLVFTLVTFLFVDFMTFGPVSDLEISSGGQAQNRP